MNRKWVSFATSLGVAVLIPATGGAQDRDLTKPTINLVSSVGCAAQDGATWTLTRASEAMVTRVPFSSTAEIEAANSTSLGSNTYTLIGVAEFLAVEGLLNSSPPEFPAIIPSFGDVLETGRFCRMNGPLFDVPHLVRCI